MPDATYQLGIDFDGGGSVIKPTEAVDADVISITVERGFVSPLARLPMVGRMTVVLKNTDKAYSPPLESDLLPGRLITLEMTTDSGQGNLFGGFIESIQPAPGLYGPRTTLITAVDFLSQLDIFEGRIGIKTDATADDIISDVVNDVDSNAITNYDDGINVFATSGEQWTLDSILGTGYDAPRENVLASQKILDACTADWGRFAIDKLGRPSFYNRHYMPLTAPLRLTLDNSMEAMAYDKRLSEIFNFIEVTYLPRTVSEQYEVLGRLTPGRAAEILPNTTETFVIPFHDPTNQAIKIGGLSVLDPVANTDYAGTSDEAGEGSNVTGDLTITMDDYADKAEVHVENTSASTVWLQRLQVRGFAVRSREPETVRASDATSIAAYGRRKLAINATLMSTPFQAKALADYLLTLYKDPHDIVSGLMFTANRSSTLLNAAKDIELLDKVVVSEDQTGLSSFTGHVTRIRHEIRNAKDHKVWIDLETPLTYENDPFRINTSTLGSGDILIY